MQKSEEYKKYNNGKKVTIRGFLIAICMCLYDWRYFWLGNLNKRLKVIHDYTNYIQIKAPILKAAKHCAYHWTIVIIDNHLHDTFGAVDRAKHFYKL